MNSNATRSALAIFTLASAAAGLGCSDPFDPYNELQTLRVLAVRADRPYLAPGERANLDTLTYVPAASGRPAPEVTYEWSWCPLTSGTSAGFECVLGREELQSLADHALPPDARITVPDYALGSDATAVFDYPASPELVRALCTALRSVTLPALAAPPRCDGGLDVSIRLVVRAGDEQVTSVKAIKLLYAADAPRNANPTIGGATAELAEDAEDARAPGAGPRALSADAPTHLTRGQPYTLRLDLADDVVEPFTPAPDADDPSPRARLEQLTVTWFVEGGETDSVRTSFIDGEVPMEEARENRWTPPRVEDYAPDAMTLYFVVRDGRGGVGWIARDVLLDPAVD